MCSLITAGTVNERKIVRVTEFVLFLSGFCFVDKITFQIHALILNRLTRTRRTSPETSWGIQLTSIEQTCVFLGLISPCPPRMCRSTAGAVVFCRGSRCSVWTPSWESVSRSTDEETSRHSPFSLDISFRYRILR